MKIYLIIILAIFVKYISAEVEIPVWPDQWQQDFIEVKKENDNYYYSSGQFYYDYTTKRQRVDRDNGQVQFLCRSVTMEETPCSDIINEGKRYLYWPEKNECCYCCGYQDGCGILFPKWQRYANAEYMGLQMRQGKIYEVFKTLDGGGDPIMYWYDFETKIQAYLDRYEYPQDIVKYNESSWKDYIVNKKSLEIPQVCLQSPPYCPNDSKCGLFRGDQVKQNKIANDYLID